MRSIKVGARLLERAAARPSGLTRAYEVAEIEGERVRLIRLYRFSGKEMPIVGPRWATLEELRGPAWRKAL